jgi:hypothetical protein
VRKWRKRDATTDGGHTAHRPQTTLNAAPEELVIYLRAHLLRRRGHSRPPVPDKMPRTVKCFKACELGYIHVDVKYLPQMADETARCYVFVAIDRATRWMFIAIKSHKTAVAAKLFLNAGHKACPIKIRTLLADNGKESLASW